MSIPRANGADHDRTFAIADVAQSSPEFAAIGGSDPAPEGWRPLLPSHGVLGPLVKPFPVDQAPDNHAPNAPDGQNDGR